jgi:geranylgeranyl diphosphate synthase type II
MERLGVFEDARQAVRRYTAQARERLQVLPDGPPAQALRWLIDEMQARSH